MKGLDLDRAMELLINAHKCAINSSSTAAVSAGQEMLWLRNLLSEFGYEHSSASKLRIDNLSALSVAKNPEHHGRMKHLDLRFYWLRDEVAKGRIEVVHLRTSDMPADILTKSLAKPKVLEMVRMLGLGT